MNDNELKSHINDLDEIIVRFALNIKELNHDQLLRFPLQKSLMRQWPWILKNGPMIKTSGFFT